MAKQQTRLQFIYPAQPTQIKNWKDRHGVIHDITVNAQDEDGKPIEIHGFFKKPDLQTISLMGKFQATDPLKAGTLLFNNCKISIDPRMENDDEVKLGAMLALQQTFKQYTYSVKKL